VLVLGLSGGFDPVYDGSFGLDPDFIHDAAAVLVRDGEVIAGIEEERITRIKHTNKVWSHAVRFCLEDAGVQLSDVDRIAFYASEQSMDFGLRYLHLRGMDTGVLRGALETCQHLFEREFGVKPDREKLRFVHHHVAHVAASYYPSGFRDCLVLSVDGSGDEVSTRVVDARHKTFTTLLEKGIPDSLGFLYLEVIRFLGYHIFDEYKVMGLAPYGDPATYRQIFESFYTLEPNGDYRIHKERVMGLYGVLNPRRRDEPFNQVHKDIAASLQEAVETVVFHMLAHFKGHTGHEYLAIAGGVGQNSSMNGKILRSGLFRNVFAPSFSADQGCALGAALHVAHDERPSLAVAPVEHAYWGTDIGCHEAVERRLEAWRDVLAFERMDDPPARVARVIAGGQVVGWVQGRSEYGPRALGNRSILADPRVASHKETINAMIKKREAYRPFAPSVIEERVHEFFNVPGEARSFPFMSCVLEVRAEMRDKLPAITHVDGTARLQTVSKTANPKFWALIDAFAELSGVPILLNTSFNNNAEPIVDGIDDAIVCFLTSGLDWLVIGDFIAPKPAGALRDRIATLELSLPGAAEVVETDRYRSYTERRVEHHMVWNYVPRRRVAISPAAYRVIRGSDNGSRTVAELAAAAGLSAAETEHLHDELVNLWSLRYVRLTP
jgi:carbamoyltransferase